MKSFKNYKEAKQFLAEQIRRLNSVVKKAEVERYENAETVFFVNGKSIKSYKKLRKGSKRRVRKNV